MSVLQKKKPIRCALFNISLVDISTIIDILCFQLFISNFRV